MTTHFKFLTVLAAGSLFAAGAAGAAPFLTESFNYGNLTPSGGGYQDMSGQNGGTGFQGGWVTSYLNTAGPNSTYTNTGLTFGNEGVGGAAYSGMPDLGNGNGEWSLFSRQLNVTATGTVYGSYIFNATSAPYSGVADMVIGNEDSTDGGPIALGAQEYGSGTSGVANAWKAGSRISGHTATVTGPTLTNNTTYKYLFQLGNVGGTSGPETINSWILTAAQYNTFATAGQLNEAALNAATTGTAAGDVTEILSNSYTPSTYGSITPTSWLTFYVFNASKVAASKVMFDEVAMSQVSLADATTAAAAVPEPAPVAVMGLGLLAVGLLLRRRFSHRSVA